jgi:vacuolar-type H+-ATPase subunit I/STV1
MANERPLSALPSPLARILAFVAILVAGLAGALIGYALVDIQYENASDVALGLGLLAGAIISAGGTAVVAILVLRAIGEWRSIDDRAPR